MAGGWLLARSALLCLTEPRGLDADFIAAKVSSAHFFATQVLPDAAACERKMLAGSASVVDYATALL